MKFEYQTFLTFPPREVPGVLLYTANISPSTLMKHELATA